MLITRGFGKCSGAVGPCDPVYVPITDPKVLTDNTGKINIKSTTTTPPKIRIDTSTKNLY